MHLPIDAPAAQRATPTRVARRSALFALAALLAMLAFTALPALAWEDRVQGDSALRMRMIGPRGKREQVVSRDGIAVFVTQQVFQQDPQRDGQAPDLRAQRLLGRSQAEDGVRTVAGDQQSSRLETIDAMNVHSAGSSGYRT